MSNARDVDDAPHSNHVRRTLDAPPPAARRRPQAVVARYTLAVLGAVALVVAGYVAWRAYKGGGQPLPPAGPPPVAVAVATAAVEIWQTHVSAAGTLVAVQGVQVMSEVPGMVSETTRNFNVQATLPNDAGLLRPGMFAQVTVALAERHDVVTVPATAISYSPQGDAVFVVVEPSAVDTPGTPAAPAGSPPPTASLPTVKRTLVQVGERRGTNIAILTGVARGERVVTARPPIHWWSSKRPRRCWRRHARAASSCILTPISSSISCRLPLTSIVPRRRTSASTWPPSDATCRRCCQQAT